MRNPREVPVSVPRPARARPGAPAPWSGRYVTNLDLATIRRRLARFRPRRVEGPVAADVRRSAVLVPLYGDEAVWVVLGKRSAELPSHRGDIAFPGGRWHPEDADLRATALREAEEEMGIDPGQVEVIGELDHMGTMTSRFLIAPFVGVFHDDAQELVPGDGEVDRILLVPLARLLEPSVYRQELWEGQPAPDPSRGPLDPSVGGRWTGPFEAEREVNFFEIDEWDLVWGATATILRQLLDVVTAPEE